MEYFGTNLTEAGHYCWLLNGERISRVEGAMFNNIPFHPEYLTNNLPVGEVVFYQGGGYTVIGIAGSCIDTRGGTKSIFWVKEIITKNEMIERIKQNSLAIKIITNMPFKIKW